MCYQAFGHILLGEEAEDTLLRQRRCGKTGPNPQKVEQCGMTLIDFHELALDLPEVRAIKTSHADPDGVLAINGGD